MTRQSRNVDQVASLELSVAAFKSLISDYSVRAKQAEQMVGRLMGDKLTDEQVQALAVLVGQHMDVKATERAVQQQALLQSTLIVLNAALQGDDESLRSLVNKAVRDLTMALSHMNPTGQARNHKQQG